MLLFLTILINFLIRIEHFAMTAEIKISKTLVDIDISREEFTTTIHEERNYGKLK